MSKLFKPLLSAKLTDMDALVFPIIGSPKLDGIRGTIINGKILSRSLKRIPNLYVQSILNDPAFNGLDGELLVGSSTDSLAFNHTTSGIMSQDGEPDFIFFVFDNHTNPNDTFETRLKSVIARCKGHARLRAVPHTKITNIKDLIAQEEKFNQMGYEGLMIRDPKGVYKYGRSSEKQGILIKMKRFVDEEGTILGTYEQNENQNEATTDNLGRTKRSSAKAGKIGKNTLGGFNVMNDAGIEFKVGNGPGLSAAERLRFWAIRDSLPGKRLKYKFQEEGTVDKPRLPLYVGIRED